MKRIDHLQQTHHGISNHHSRKEHLIMPNSNRPELQNQLSQSHEPIRVVPANPEGFEITSTLAGNGYLQIDIPSTLSRDRKGPRRANRLNVYSDGTVDFQMYGDVGDLTFALQSNQSGSLDLVLLPYHGTNQGWRIPIDKILSDYSKLAPNGGEF